jgi:hypothetical protein
MGWHLVEGRQLWVADTEKISARIEAQASFQGDYRQVSKRQQTTGRRTLTNATAQCFQVALLRPSCQTVVVDLTYYSGIRASAALRSLSIA